MKDRTLTIQQFADSELVAELQRRGGYEVWKWDERIEPKGREQCKNEGFD